MLLRSSLVLLLFVVLCSGVYASSCEENMQPLTMCQVITPSMSCSGYNVYSNNGSLYQSGSLTGFAENTYYFNFSAPIGEYLSILCDGSTKTFFVNYYNLDVFGQSFNWLAIIVIIGAVSFVCLWVSRIIKKDSLFAVKQLLFFFGMLNSFVFIVLTLFISSGLQITNFNNYFNIYVMIVVVLLGFIIAYYFIMTSIDLIKLGFGKK